MALKQYKPNTPGQRGLVLVDKSDLYKGKPEKKLTEGLVKMVEEIILVRSQCGKEAAVTKDVTD